MPYPSRPTLTVLPEFEGTATPRGQTPQQRLRLRQFVAAEYERGRSLRELAELTGRTQTAVRRALDEAGVPRRGRGARRVKNLEPEPERGASPAPFGPPTLGDERVERVIGRKRDRLDGST